LSTGAGGFGLPPQNLLQYFPDLGRVAHKVIYGSDWPGVPDLAKNLQSIKELPLTYEQKEMILGKNALGLLKL
jgi:predicted TIM-barrel fold metal-dependent hydrolase